MTNIEKEAKIFSNQLYGSKEWNPGEDMLAKAFIAGANYFKTQLENMTSIAEYQQSSNMKRHFTIKDLEKQIDKMKCCQNCNHWLDEVCQVGHYFDCKHNSECGEEDYKDYWEMYKNVRKEN